MLAPLLNNPFFLTAILASFLSSIASGIVGSFVVVQRISFIAGSIAHSVLGGMGICLWLQRVHGMSSCDPVYGAFISAIGSAFLLGYIHLHYRQRQDAVIAAIWSTGMAIGIIALSLTPGTNVELLNYLFGNILFISTSDLLFLLLLNALILAIVAMNYQKFLAIALDVEQAHLQKVSVQKLYFLLLSLIAASIVLLMQMMGTILVIALLTIPATIASLFTRRLLTMMLGAIFFSMLFCTLGISFAFWIDWPPGATIALLLGVSYLCFLSRKKKISLKREPLPIRD